VLAAVVMVCSALFAALAEGGEGVGSPPLLVSSPNAFVVEAQVGSGAGGFAAAVWNQVVGTGGSTLVVATRASASADWSAPVRLDGVGDETTVKPEVAVAPSGAAVVVWQSLTGGSAIRAVARSSARGSWSAPAAIASGGLYGSRQLGINTHGDAVLLYTTGSGGGQQLDSVSLKPATGKWSAPVVVGKSNSELIDPTVAVSATGEAVGVWSTSRRPPRGNTGDDRFDSWVEASILRAGTWSAPQRLGQETQFEYDLNTDATPDGPQVAIDDRGNAMVVWQHDRSGLQLVADAAALGRDAARWRSLSSLNAIRVISPQLVSSPGGWVTIAWETYKSGVATTSGPISGCCWSPVTTFSQTPKRFDFDLNLVAGPGHAAALAFAKVGRPMQLAVHPTTGGHWATPLSLTPGPGHGRTDPIPRSLAVSPTGQVLTAWTQESPSATPDLLEAPLEVTNTTER
jgi:hypothetical protein